MLMFIKNSIFYNFFSLDGSWNTSDPVTINVGSAAIPVSKMLPVGDKLWCSCHNTVKIFDTVTLQFQVSKNDDIYFVLKKCTVI